MEDAINTGIAVVIAIVLALVGTTAVTQSNYDTVLTLDSETEWNNYVGTATTTEVTSDGYVRLQSGNTTGSWESSTISNATNRVVTYVDLPQADNQSVNLTVGSETFELEDGRNTFDLSSNLSSYTITYDFERDSTSVTRSEVDYYLAQQGESDGLLSLIAGAAFALLVLLAVFELMQRRRAGGSQ